MKQLLCLVLCTLLLPLGGMASAAQKPLSVSAASALVMDASTGTVLFEKNADTKRSMASTTKIMTTLLLLEQGNLQKELTVTQDMVQVEGTSMGLLPGDTVTREALCYGMMLASGNDAANVAAIAHSGSLEAFQNAMNQKAGTLGMKNTHFVTPSGLDDEEHYSTAYDMALLTAQALKNPIFCQIAASSSARVSYGNPPYRRTLTNHNKLLSSYEGCIGVKTGFTKKSGRCLVSAATRDGGTLICVTLSAPDDWNDHKALLDYGFGQMEPIEYKENSFTLPVVGGIGDTLTVGHETLTLSLPRSAKKDLIFTLQAPPFLYAPIQKNQPIGELLLLYKGKVIEQVPLLARDTLSQLVYTPTLWEQMLVNLRRLLC
ncbi:MAG: D-alanyl-D-alanine carboxypeptidase [Clostridia bacterium]|nr:D-alanyl-D-alanine carboxypeptidase [Clostridia bacterium]